MYEGLNGKGDSNNNGVITAEEAFQYAKPALEDWADHESLSIHPQIYDGDTSAQVTIIGGQVVSDIWIKITVENIWLQDDIEWLHTSEADWYYKIRIFSEDVGYVTTKYCPREKDDYAPGFQHKIDVIDNIIDFKIKLMDDDNWAELFWDDLADISSRSGGGTDNYVLSEWFTGENENAIYHGTYNLIDNSLTGDSRTPEGDGKYLITGESDDQSGDHNDAQIRIKIEDNYNLVADGGDSYTGVEDVPIQFNGQASGGKPDYTYSWTFGDGATGSGQNPTHSYSSTGTYDVTLTVRDAFGTTAVDDDIEVTVSKNQPPNPPSISGETYGTGGKTYTYTFTARDPNDGDKIDIYIDWGDGDSDTITDLDVDESKGVTHSFPESTLPKNYIIRARGTDLSNNEGDWGTLSVTMPVIKEINNPLIKFILSMLPKLIEFLSSLDRLTV
jgi:hypothetical protein